MENEQIKKNLADMTVLSQSATPAAALRRINELETVLHKLAYWFDTDQEVLDNMTAAERDDHIRQHKMVINALF
jgi:hypothetical protein